MKYEIYYHIYVNENELSFELVQEQIHTIKQSIIYDKIDKINCCVSGSDENIYNKVIDYITNEDLKFQMRRKEFNNKSYERFTLNCLISDANEDTSYLYFHSKGVSKFNNINIENWRRCMEYFLIVHMDLQLLEKYDTVGVFYMNNPKHYQGNFWWASGKYLIQLSERKKIQDDYYGPENYLLSDVNLNPKIYYYYNNIICSYHSLFITYDKYKFIKDSIQNSNKEHLYVIYGSDNNKLTVTKLFCDNFLYNNIIYIPSNYDFNSIFTDPEPYVAKKITINYKTNTYIVKENSKLFILRLN